MKIIAVDRYARPWISDVVVMENFQDNIICWLVAENKIEIMSHDLDGFLEYAYFKIVPDDYPLYDANNRNPYINGGKC